MSTALTIALGSLLILVGVLGLIFFSRSRRQVSSKYSVPAVRSRTPEQELNELGILEIRPKERTRHMDEEEDDLEEEFLDEEEVDFEEDEETMHAEDELEEIVDEEEEDPDEDLDEEFAEEATVLDEISEQAEQEQKRASVSRREALFRMLNAVQASLDGYTACLVKKEAASQYSIEAIVSENPQIIHVGSPTLSATVIEHPGRSDAAVTVLEVGGNITPEMLGYYKEPVDVRQVAIAPVKIPDNRDTYYLLIDALDWQDLDDPWQRLMIGQHSNLLGTFLASPQMDPRANGSKKPRVRPRREIIAEEMTRSRAHGHPLALALVYLNQAEDIASIGPRAVGEAEQALEEFLHTTVNDVRIERFGELTFGVFHEENVSEVEAWALLVQEEMERDGNAFFERGVSIGIALLQERHANADDLRADATEALRESFETGACTIIE